MAGKQKKQVQFKFLLFLKLSVLFLKTATVWQG